jgi:hypothetical protein
MRGTLNAGEAFIHRSQIEGDIMTKQILLAAGLVLAAPFAVAPVMAQDAPQTVVQYKVDIAAVSVGYRATKVIGSSIQNEAGDKIGTVDDLIVTRNDRVMYAILSVGGFLGVGDKLVAVPFTSLKFADDHTVLAGATKESLKALPKFTYAK